MSVRVLTILTAMVAVLAAGPARGARAAEDQPDWRELNAYTIGVQAYIYTFPWSYMSEQRWFRSEDVGHRANQLFHFRDLKDASHVDGGSPNNDTIYSRAWLYLKDEPVILTVPAIADRYHSVQLTDFMDDNFAYAGMRTTGNGGGIYAIVAKTWTGTLPAGVTVLPSSSTPWAFSVGDRSAMKRDPDGGLTIYVQEGSPGPDKETNWLPAPDGPFILFLRAYLPAADIVNQSWRPPKIMAVGG